MNVTFKAIKTFNGNSMESPVWGILLKFKDDKKAYFAPDVFWYSEGWSQGSGRSVKGYYLNTLGYGSAGNGSGQSSQTTPYLSKRIQDYLLDDLKKFLEHTNNPTKEILWIEVPYSSTIKEIKETYA